MGDYQLLQAEDVAGRSGGTTIDWHEDYVLLKAAFPVDIRNTNATYDIQFGNIERPTHHNTSWDAAKFEVEHQMSGSVCAKTDVPGFPVLFAYR